MFSSCFCGQVYFVWTIYVIDKFNSFCEKKFNHSWTKFMCLIFVFFLTFVDSCLAHSVMDKFSSFGLWPNPYWRLVPT